MQYLREGILYKYPYVKQFFQLDPAIFGFENTLKSDVLEINWRILQREFTKFGIFLQKSVKINIQQGITADIRELLLFLLEFEKSGGPERIAHTILAAASMPIIPIIGKEYQLINPLPQIKAMVDRNIPKLHFPREVVNDDDKAH